MTFYVCSCGLLFGEHKEPFEKHCEPKGHTLFCIEAGLYRLIYDFQKDNSKLRETLEKRNRNIAVLKSRVQALIIELRVDK